MGQKLLTLYVCGVDISDQFRNASMILYTFK